MRFPVLNDSTLFRGLSEAEIENLLEGTGYRVRFFPSGTMIALAGEEIHSLMIVLSGSVRGRCRLWQAAQ